jgi:hypothetical protein
MAAPFSAAILVPLRLINQPHPPLLLPQDPQAEFAGPNSMLELILKPYPRKSTITGLAFS